MTNKLSLDVRMSRTGDALQIEFEGKNTLDQRIYVADKLVKSNGRNDYTTVDGAIVMNHDEPGVSKDIVKIVIGQEGTDRETATVPSPTYRPVEPGGAVVGKVRVPYPLKSWHPLGGTNPLRPSTKVLFKLYYFVGEPKKWISYPSSTQGPIQIPDGISKMLFQTSPMPLP